VSHFAVAISEKEKQVDNRLHRVCVRHIVLLVLWVSCMGAAASAETFTIMAANITSGSSQKYESPGIRIFQGLKPDVVLIQEFNYSGSLRDLVDEAFGTEYDYYVESGSESIPNGIISRFPILSAGQWNDSYVSNRDFAWAVIDLPGDIDLQAVSVHLVTSSATTRNNEARDLRDYVEANFDDNHYIVVGGDLNTTNRSEDAVDTFKTFLDADDHRPKDQESVSYTNEPRSRPYDWVMPNHLLDEQHVDLHIGSSVYPNGIVFDSEVYTPLDEVYPVQYGDSHVSGMQHMAVMKTYNLGDVPPTPTAPPPPTPTSGGPPTNTPTPTPSSGCDSTGVSIWMPYQTFYPGFGCSCTATICNAEEQPLTDNPLFMILDVMGSYFFAPGFTEFDYYSQTFPVGETTVVVLPEFTWPTGAGTLEGVTWYGALTDPDITQLVGDMGVFTFGWKE
jgi:endonuclease/exonuclease/phosphatase family metal-dependent hydrolase